MTPTPNIRMAREEFESTYHKMRQTIERRIYDYQQTRSWSPLVSIQLSVDFYLVIMASKKHFRFIHRRHDKGRFDGYNYVVKYGDNAPPFKIILRKPKPAVPKWLGGVPQRNDEK